MSKIMTAEEWIKKFHPNTETFNVARLEIELKAYAQYYHSQMTAPQDVEKVNFTIAALKYLIEDMLTCPYNYFHVDGKGNVRSVGNCKPIIENVEEYIKTLNPPKRLFPNFGYSLRQEKDAVEFAEFLDNLRNTGHELYKDMKIWGKEDAFRNLYRQFKNNGR